MVACDREILLFQQKSSHFQRKVSHCFSDPCRQDAMVTSCAAADTPVLLNCFWISGTPTSVVKHVGDGIDWGRWEESVGLFMVLDLLGVKLISFSWPWGTTIGLASWVVHMRLPLCLSVFS